MTTMTATTTFAPENFDDSRKNGWSIADVEAICQIVGDLPVLINIDSRTGFTLMGTISNPRDTRRGGMYTPVVRVTTEHNITDYSLRKIGAIIVLPDPDGLVSMHSAIGIVRESKQKALTLVKQFAEVEDGFFQHEQRDGSKVAGNWEIQLLGGGLAHVSSKPQSRGDHFPSGFAWWEVNLNTGTVAVGR